MLSRSVPAAPRHDWQLPYLRVALILRTLERDGGGTPDARRAIADLERVRAALIEDGWFN